MSLFDIIIPAYNEEHRIHRTLDHYVRYFDDSVHFTVVLNGCHDGTLGVVERTQKNFPDRITIINIPEAIGKGGAIRQGWQLSTAEYIGFVDADGATAPQEFAKVLAAARVPGKTGAVASRFLPEAQIIERTSWLRTLVSKAAIRLVRWLFHLPFSDTQCGAKVFQRSVVTPILPKLSTTNLLFDIELLWWLHHTNNAIADVPTIWVDQPGSVMLGSSMKFLIHAARMFFSVLALRLRLLRYARS